MSFLWFKKSMTLVWFIFFNFIKPLPGINMQFRNLSQFQKMLNNCVNFQFSIMKKLWDLAQDNLIHMVYIKVSNKPVHTQDRPALSF